MTILVADTSVLVELEHGGLLQVVFGRSVTLVVPDLLYERELAARNGTYLQSLGLSVVELTPAEMSEAQVARSSRPGLSLPDCYAFACALRTSHALCTDDQALKKVAVARGIAVGGTLGLLDRLHREGMDKQTLRQGLAAMRDHLKCRLPRDEVEARLASWS